MRGQLDRLPGFGLVARCRSPARQEQKPVGAALLKTRHQNLPLRDRTLEFHVRGQFPHAETRSLWTKRRPIAAFRAQGPRFRIRRRRSGSRPSSPPRPCRRPICGSQTRRRPDSHSRTMARAAEQDRPDVAEARQYLFSSSREFAQSR
jgi:hypothetical protein